ncbi:SPOSA6832_01570 [Sporobolomyces salmonicolor]|uniref:SPOSA6832_01570-mRNA-1:cds n=1 Tax=Sporidiobolus salmonicolor TaxID=5005 RepID=A0A0D6EJ95_SPOSA|nr:SPOSA6832_01570 [Sporobolomyces salmonicolor]
MAQYPFPTQYNPQSHAYQYNQQSIQPPPHPYTHEPSRCAQTPVVAAASTSTSLASDPRVPPAPAPLIHSPTTSQDPLGTSQNPLIPKRRRRTTPAELAILEDEFRKNSRPDQGERGRIAQRLGMTCRAVQVWYQNRRQKEKKESSSIAGSSKASSVTSGDLSSPKDVEGVSLSFSSSPLPSPALPLYPIGVSRRPSFDVATTIKALPSSQELYAAPNPNDTSANKENNYAHFLSRSASVSNPAAPTSEQPQQQPYLYSYPSSQASQSSAHQQSSFSAQPSPAASVPSVYLHRPSNTSIIAAKKHPRKHRLGRSWTTAEPASSGKVTLAEVASRKVSLRRNVSTSSAVATGSSLFSEAGGDRARSWLDSLSRRRTAGEDDSTDLDAAGEADPDVPVPASTATTTLKHAEADDLLCHMQSDPPSASSPAPVTRKRVLAHDDASLSATLGGAEDESDDGEDGDAGTFKPASYAQRPAFQHSHSQPIRSLSSVFTGASSSTPSTGAAVPSKARTALLRTSSLGGASPLPLPTSFSASPFSATSATLSSRSLSRNAAFSPSLAQAAESSRAGTEEACAISALERKRARILSDGLSLSLGSLPRGGTAKEKESLRERSTKRRRSSGLSTADTTDSESLADLSFSSTSTASTVDSLATVDSYSGAGYFALTAAAKQLDSAGQVGKVGGAGAKDEERECAELLLGLGGFF